jgi:hypothetical protein
MELGMLIWVLGGASFLLAYSLLSRRFYRARGAKLGDGPRPSGLYARYDDGVERGMTLWQRQSDPDLEKMRRQAIAAVVAFPIWGIGAMNVLARLPFSSVVVSMPSLPLPSVGGMPDASGARWWAIAVSAGLVLFYLWWLNVALSKPGDWLSGKQGDPYRWPRNWVVAACLFGIVTVPVVFWFSWTVGA